MNKTLIAESFIEIIRRSRLLIEHSLPLTEKVHPISVRIRHPPRHQ